MRKGLVLETQVRIGKPAARTGGAHLRRLARLTPSGRTRSETADSLTKRSGEPDPYSPSQKTTGFEMPRTDSGLSRSVARVRGKRASQPEIPAEVPHAPRCLRHRSGVA